jgi:hypothetical protein
VSPANKPRIVNFQAEYAKHADFTRPACVPIRRYPSVVCEIAFGEPLKTPSVPLTLPSWRFSRTIEIYSQHPASFLQALECDQICSRPRRSAMVTAWVRSLA